ncbi:major facilitator superfamily MFS_1 [Cupriavidus necator N-1]|uniref:Major facilitator superfamily MFS_1 n=1 Tax=Cupriavidus necator (strain ATCC 43291 / DSM 13513 / CCUG 52238 / LMG 8453 / N-1) TaxID=1042878 RepID=G0EWK4_CUPNN|nr:MFS transporter [Cupriavidus necator]AEI78461.1 major facilitator superfamily MFS_1 [Cupriavidus necator N-1]MDX6013015.1 MFS transporter [Cupriavidus necator]
MIPTETAHAGPDAISVPQAQAQAREDAVYRKVAWRLLPFLMLCYVVAYLDRVNVGFAKLSMLADLQFSEAVYGLGAGLFFIGYFFFEVPSNLLMHRIGAKATISRIMILWSLISAAMMFVQTSTQFYVLRFLLGAAEAGFYPGMILYLTYWFPSHRRARMVALFMAAIPISGIFGGPLSGWVMEAMHGVNGLRGWQWMFVIEAVPSLLVGVAVLWYLDNNIQSARWLTADEKALLERNIAAENAQKSAHMSLRTLVTDSRVLKMTMICFCTVMGQYGLTFWLPTLIKQTGVKSVLDVGLLTAIPFGVAVCSMILVSRSSDRMRERRWHLIVPFCCAATGLVLSAVFSHNTALSLAALALAAGGSLATSPLFWSLPTSILSGVGAAAGIALINSFANLAGFISPYMIGLIKDATRSTDAAMFVLAAVLLCGALLTYSVPARLVNK